MTNSGSVPSKDEVETRAAIADRITFRCTLNQTGTESGPYPATAAEHVEQGA